MKNILLFISLFYALSTLSQSVLPVPDHIVVVIMENHAYSQIIDSPEAPHINALARDVNSCLFTQSFAIEYPSQPNYLHLYSGCNQGVTDDNMPEKYPFTSPNLGRQLIDAGRNFITYSEDLPSVGYNGQFSGNYVRKHNPAANWMGTGTNQIPPETNQPFTSFPSSDFTLLPTVCFVVPNMNNDMHDGSIAQGDQWIYDHLGSYIEWAKSHNSLFILTFDEDNRSEENRIVTIFSGQMVQEGPSSTKINHYSILRTIEEMYGLPYACNASTTAPITGIWSQTVDNPTELWDNEVIIYPNPTHHSITLEFLKNNLPDKLKLSFTNALGKKVKEIAIQSAVFHIELNDLNPGIYLYQLNEGKKMLKKGKIILE